MSRVKQGLAFIWVGCAAIWVGILTNSDPIFWAGVVTEFAIGIPVWFVGMRQVRRQTRSRV